ncbi:hypothetical protein [Paenibacillus terrae]|uniref:hypothetical protein n=1 Tax=Paenibacillus terrae TaxID=159743 RepID=UPI0011EB87C7|nr:hypothetical protein [Paenibacillus terrae]
MMKVLARKGNIVLVQYEGLYAVEKVTKSVGKTLAAGEIKSTIVSKFAEIIKTVRKGQFDFNLEIYGR